MQQGDVAVTALFTLPWLKRARSVSIMHELYPEVLVVAGWLRRNRTSTNLCRSTPSLISHVLSAVVSLGHHTDQHLWPLPGMESKATVSRLP
jgi:colanic acid biosynthesis glycosyl transferase WcaI